MSEQRYTTTSPDGAVREGISIDFGAIKVGDLVRAVRDYGDGLRTIHEGRVASIGSRVEIRGGQGLDEKGIFLGSSKISWELISRPKPPKNELRPGMKLRSLINSSVIHTLAQDDASEDGPTHWVAHHGGLLYELDDSDREVFEDPEKFEVVQ